MNNKLKFHWDQVYSGAKTTSLGWYEENPEPSIKLIHLCQLNKYARILNVGSGPSTLVDELLRQGYENIIANDISYQALENLKLRLGRFQSNRVHWLVDDLTHPQTLNTLEQVDLWHDRAVLHFFTGKSEQDTYFNLLKQLVKPNKFAIIATFNLSGAIQCSGLPVQRYDQNILQEKLGQEFILIEAFNYTYTMPLGDSREYVYTLFKRISI